MDGAPSDLHVNPDPVGQKQPELLAPNDPLTAECATKVRQQGTQRLRRGRRRALTPECFDRVEPIHRAVPFEHQKRKQSACLQTTQPAGTLLTVEQNHELSAELNPIAAEHASDRRQYSPIPPSPCRRRSQCLPRWEPMLTP